MKSAVPGFTGGKKKLRAGRIPATVISSLVTLTVTRLTRFILIEKYGLDDVCIHPGTPMGIRPRIGL